MNILSLDSPYSPFFSLIVQQLPEVSCFRAIFSKSGYRHYFAGDGCEFLGRILARHTTYTQEDMALAKQSHNHYSAYVGKFSGRKLNQEELAKLASFAHYFRLYLQDHQIDFVMMHNDLRWHHALARDICLQLGVPFCVSELGLFRPYTMTLDFHGVNANASIASLDVDFAQYADLPERPFNVPEPFYGHESLRSKRHFLRFLLLNKLGGLCGLNSSIAHNALRIRPYLQRFWQQTVKRGAGGAHQQDGLPGGDYVFFPMQLENDTQFLIHSDFSSNQTLLNDVEHAFYQSDLASTHQLVVKLHPNDLGSYQADNRTRFTQGNTTQLVNHAAAIISVNSTVCMEALETDKPLFVLGRAFFARADICQPVTLDMLSAALSQPQPVSVAHRKGFIHYLKFQYSVEGAGYSFQPEELRRVAQRITEHVRQYRKA